MGKKKSKSKQSPNEYIPVINKQLRWILCRKIAEALYYSRETHIYLEKLLEQQQNNVEPK